MLSPSSGGELSTAAAGVGLTMVYQPVVTLSTGQVVGYEALARWPSLRDPAPQCVFSHAKAVGALVDLERQVMRTAISGAASQGLPDSATLLINSEPASSYSADYGDDVIDDGLGRFQIVVELTERHLLANPATLLKKVAALRARGCRIALDDVGASHESLALLDVVGPDVVKLDMTVVQAAPHVDQTRTLAGVLAYRENTGAAIVAEGIETEAHYRRAVTLGATLGQGFHLGRPGSIDPAAAGASNPSLSRLRPPPVQPRGSVFDLIATGAPTFTVDYDTAQALTQTIARKSRHHVINQPIVLTSVPSAAEYAELRTGFRALGVSSPLVAVFGIDMPDGPLGDGVRGVRLEPSDPLGRETALVTLGCDVATALAARPRRDVTTGTRGMPPYDITITHNRDLVTQAARTFLGRMT
ncbi:EAL domain-containing protein [Mycolicibacterium komossense]|uniref:EAL domain-containing protein n=1 Tax=Mycolicibacterium komossense TaxID=1779 RepID=A0ABT3CFI2_9MYCO|nr:EAL domain-containing protein [Mycolicibacterium komossense]MCV7228230.1 EAL domain-containing protein [Mycolicibacterium komossense]